MTETKTLTRDDLRAQIFAPKAFKSRSLKLFGAEVEIRQPSLGDILTFQDEVDKQTGLILLLTGYCYVPGTNEKVFEEADADGILNMPFGDDLIKLNEIIEELTGIDVAGEEGN